VWLHPADGNGRHTILDDLGPRPCPGVVGLDVRLVSRACWGRRPPPRVRVAFLDPGRPDESIGALEEALEPCREIFAVAKQHVDADDDRPEQDGRQEKVQPGPSPEIVAHGARPAGMPWVH
jgi:hypothetical protein